MQKDLDQNDSGHDSSNGKHDTKHFIEKNNDESFGAFDSANIVTEQINKLKRQRMYGCVRNIVKSVSKKSRDNTLDSVYDRPYDPVDGTNTLRYFFVIETFLQKIEKISIDFFGRTLSKKKKI